MTEQLSPHLTAFWDSFVAQMVKNLSAMKETWVLYLGWEDSRRKEQQPTPVFLAGESYGERSLVESMVSQRVKHD